MWMDLAGPYYQTSVSACKWMEKKTEKLHKCKFNPYLIAYFNFELQVFFSGTNI